MKEKKKVFGVGITDVNTRDCDGKELNSYAAWCGMLRRCYDSKCHEKHPQYTECSVCEDWLTYSNFKKFYDTNYKEGFQLDKDILIQGNKIYSPQNCVFVPQYINQLLTHKQRTNNSGFIGVSWDSNNNKWRVVVNQYGKQKHLGRFVSLEDASAAYISAKTEHIRDVATNALSIGDIDQRTYNALLNYKV